MDAKQVDKVLEEVLKAPTRKFKESVDLVVNLKGIDFKDPSKKIDLKIQLPTGRGKEIKVGVFGDTDFLKKAKSADVKIADTEIGKDPRRARKVAASTDFFIAQSTLMVEIGKSWGKALGSRGKMPQPLPPQADPTPIIDRLKKTVMLRGRGKNPNTIHCAVGTRDMKSEDLAKNVIAVMSPLVEKLPQGEQNIRSAYLKTTMGAGAKLI